MEDGSLNPGCLTSEDEERETWTAESLRVSVNEGFGFRGLRPDERLRRYTFKGYTIVISDVNRGWLLASANKKWWDLVKRCDQPAQSFKSNLRV